MLQHKKITIELKDNGKYLLTWEHEPQVVYRDGKPFTIEASATTCEDEYDLLATLISPFEIDFNKLKVDAIRMHTQDLSADWYTEEEYCELNNITKGILREKIKEGKVDKLIIQGITFVSDKL